jgi:phosphate transport system protein
VRALFREVALGVAQTTPAFVGGDLGAAVRFAGQDRVAWPVLGRVEEEIQTAFALQVPVAGELRFLLTVLRVVPELERSADLAAHIAGRASLANELTPELVAVFESMGTMTTAMWETAAAAWADCDPTAAAALDEQDDELDVTTTELPALLAAAELNPVTSMQFALVGRFYERLGDHAVHICDRIRWWATGS